MSLKTILRLLALFLAVFSVSVPLFAQQDDAPSVAEAARRARQQKQEAAKPAHVIDNDVIAPSPAASVPTPVPAAPAADTDSSKPAATAVAAGSSVKSAGDKADEEKKKADIEALKQEIADKLAKVNLQQREIALTQDSYLSNPDHEHDKTGKEKLDSMQLDLTQLQAELTELQAKLAALAPPSDEKTPESSQPEHR